MSGGVKRFDPPVPRVMQTVTMVLPARAHLASVPPTVNSWSSGWAWMLIDAGRGRGLHRRPLLLAALGDARGAGDAGIARSPSRRCVRHVSSGVLSRRGWDGAGRPGRGRAARPRPRGAARAAGAPGGRTAPGTRRAGPGSRAARPRSRAWPGRAAPGGRRPGRARGRPARPRDLPGGWAAPAARRRGCPRDSNQFRSPWHTTSQRPSGVRVMARRKKRSVRGSRTSLPSWKTRPSASTR